MNEYSEVSQLRTQIAILESQLDHQTSTLRTRIELLNGLNTTLTLDNTRQAVLITTLSQSSSGKEIVKKAEKDWKEPKTEPKGGLGPIDSIPGNDG